MNVNCLNLPHTFVCSSNMLALGRKSGGRMRLFGQLQANDCKNEPKTCDNNNNSITTTNSKKSNNWRCTATTATTIKKRLQLAQLIITLNLACLNPDSCRLRHCYCNFDYCVAVVDYNRTFHGCSRDIFRCGTL